MLIFTKTAPQQGLLCNRTSARIVASG